MCVNNQRQIGRGFNAWAAEHGGDNPWWVTSTKGGTKADGAAILSLGGRNYPAGIAQNAWFQFMWVYEELPSPSILVCPSDPLKQRASDFSVAPGGFANLSMQNNALSYIIGAHALRERPREILSADRNLQTVSGTSGCSSGILNVRSIFTPVRGGEGSSWTNGIHGPSGNLLMNDSHVEQMNNADLNAFLNSAVTTSNDGNGTFHLLFP